MKKYGFLIIFLFVLSSFFYSEFNIGLGLGFGFNSDRRIYEGITITEKYMPLNLSEFTLGIYPRYRGKIGVTFDTSLKGLMNYSYSVNDILSITSNKDSEDDAAAVIQAKIALSYRIFHDKHLSTFKFFPSFTYTDIDYKKAVFTNLITNETSHSNLSFEHIKTTYGFGIEYFLSEYTTFQRGFYIYAIYNFLEKNINNYNKNTISIQGGELSFGYRFCYNNVKNVSPQQIEYENSEIQDISTKNELISIFAEKKDETNENINDISSYDLLIEGTATELAQKYKIIKSTDILYSEEAWILAAQYNKDPNVFSILSAYNPIDIKTNVNILRIAIEKNQNLLVVKKLLDLGIYPQNIEEKNLIYNVALQKENEKILNFLIQKEDSVEALLYFSVVSNNYQLCKYLIDLGVDLVNANYAESYDYFSDNTYFDFLKSYKKDLIYVDILKVAATYSQSEEIIKLLLQNKAGMNKKNYNKETTDFSYPALLLAIKYNQNIEIIKALFNAGDPLYDDFSTFSKKIIHEASKRTTDEVLKFLLINNFNIDERDFLGSTVLITAVKEGNLSSVNLLLENGADVNAKTLNGFTALMYASAKQQIEMIKILINKGSFINSIGDNGVTPLLCAVTGFSPEHFNNISYHHYKREIFLSFQEYVSNVEINKHMIEYLITQEANVNTKTSDGTTILMYAVINADPEIIIMLINAGAQIEIKNDKNDDALMLSLFSDYKNNTNILLKNYNKYSVLELNDALLISIIIDNSSSCRNLIESGAQVNFRDEDDTNILMFAAAYVSDLSFLDYILELKIDINETNKNGMTALMFAAKNTKKSELIKLLIDKGADTKIKDLKNYRAIDYARENRNIFNSESFWRLNDLSY